VLTCNVKKQFYQSFSIPVPIQGSSLLFVADILRLYMHWWYEVGSTRVGMLHVRTFLLFTKDNNDQHIDDNEVCIEKEPRHKSF